jgi:small-conductance mechanosensitive channel
MGYFDTVKEAKIGRDAIIKNQAKDQTSRAVMEMKPKINNAIIDAAKQGVKAGATSMYKDINNALGAHTGRQLPAMGMSSATAQDLGNNALMEKASAIVDQLDSAQDNGTPPQELARVFNSLDPNLKKAVQQIKINKEQLKQQELDAINQVSSMQENQMNQNVTPGSAVDRINSPITKQVVPAILDETMSIGSK